MLHIEELYSLKDRNTFGIDATADYFVSLSTLDQIKEFVNNQRYKQISSLILGGGSNILITGNYKGMVVKPNIEGIEIIIDDNDNVEVRVGAGVDWDYFVDWAVTREYYGIENLSLIPGTVGACPIQNIGAYGVEVKNCISSVDGLWLHDGKPFSLKNFDCEFGYRSSVFKTRYKNNFIITHVHFRLQKKSDLVTNYGSVEAELEKLGTKNIKSLRQAIINIRSSKLPDHKVIGNAGSFFKNPVISASKAKELQKRYPEMPVYLSANNMAKIPAAFLIEKCDWKGYRIGDAGVHEKQPLVLVNYGKAKGIEILDLAQNIQESIRKTFEIDLEIEVNII